MINLPEEFVKEMETILGGGSEAFFKSYELPPFKGLRHYKGNIEGYVEGRIPWTENGYYIKDEGAGKDLLHYCGAYYIQEPSAMVPARVMEYLINKIFPSGEPHSLRLLDLCAAPGGKTTMMARALGEGALIMANEIHPKRAAILSENVERMGLSNVVVINEDPQRLRAIYPGHFHAILVDAPCSGEGMFRKNPLAIEEWSPENVRLCRERQRDILDCAMEMLLPGGLIVYSTCTFNRLENEDNMEWLLNSRQDSRIPDMDRMVRELHIEGGEASRLGIRLWPHRVKGEGHFVSAIML